MNFVRGQFSLKRGNLLFEPVFLMTSALLFLLEGSLQLVDALLAGVVCQAIVLIFCPKLPHQRFLVLISSAFFGGFLALRPPVAVAAPFPSELLTILAGFLIRNHSGLVVVVNDQRFVRVTTNGSNRFSIILRSVLALGFVLSRGAALLRTRFGARQNLHCFCIRDVLADAMRGTGLYLRRERLFTHSQQFIE
jgi:hypothetical protein